MTNTVFDGALSEYSYTTQLGAIAINPVRTTVMGSAAIFDNVTPSPDGEYLLVSRIKRPFSHLIPMNGFPEEVEVWTRKGDLAQKIADVPSREGVPLTGVQTGPRAYHWRQDQPATVVG